MSGGVDSVGVLFKEHFQDTYGHPIQRGNLQYTLENNFSKGEN